MTAPIRITFKFAESQQYTVEFSGRFLVSFDTSKIKSAPAVSDVIHKMAKEIDNA